MKNTLDYFLEEHYFKPSAIVSYSPGIFGGINAAQQLRLIFAELGAPSILHPLLYQEFVKHLGRMVNLLMKPIIKGIKFLVEFEWYIEALKNQRENGTPY